MNTYEITVTHIHITLSALKFACTTHLRLRPDMLDHSNCWGMTQPNTEYPLNTSSCLALSALTPYLVKAMFTHDILFLKLYILIKVYRYTVKTNFFVCCFKVEINSQSTGYWASKSRFVSLFLAGVVNGNI